MRYVTKIKLPFNKFYHIEFCQRKSSAVRLQFEDEKKYYNKYLNFLLRVYRSSIQFEYLQYVSSGV